MDKITESNGEIYALKKRIDDLETELNKKEHEIYEYLEDYYRSSNELLQKFTDKNLNEIWFESNK